MKGKIIVFEGPEGTGKTTIAKKLKNYLNKYKVKIVLLREPGGSKISEKIRSIILNSKNIDKKAELFLYLAARAQLINEKVKKFLKKNYIIILDRFYLATIVYQGYARKINIDFIKRLNKFILEDIKPDITIILDASLNTIFKRIKQRGVLNRIDCEKMSFHKKVKQGYLKEAKKEKNCFIIKTDDKNIKEVFGEILKLLKNKKII